MSNQFTKRSFTLKRICNKFILHLGSKTPFLKMEFRAKIAQIGGVKILNANNTKIGYDVLFDDLNPQDITIGENTIITSGTKIITHFATGEYRDFIFMARGQVFIGSNVFIGMNTVIAKPLTIGDGAIIGANSVVICDIPPYQIWGGTLRNLSKIEGISSVK